MTTHPAALVLADHIPLTVTRGVGGDRKVRCVCDDWVGNDYDHPAHLADVLDRAGLLADGTPPETPTTRVLGERADRRTT